MTTESEPRVWLDALPDDVSLRIAKFLRVVDHPGRVRPDGLNLAQVSDKQTRIVLTVAGNNFHIANLINMPAESAESWCVAVSSNVNHLNLSYKGDSDQTKIRDILLRSQNLESLTILAEPEILKTIAHIPSLRKLRFARSSNYSYQPSLVKNIPLLFDTLSKLDLTTLHLDCQLFQPPYDEESDDPEDMGYVFKCGFRTLLRYDPDPGALGKCCPALRTLSIRCCHTSEWAPLPDFLDGFKNLSEFTPDFMPEDLIESQEISDALVERMRKFDSVHLSHIDFLVSRAADIGAPVKTLECSMWKYHKMYEPQDMELLSKCPDLVTLDLCIRPGVEKAFPEVARNFKSLRTLSIEWDVERDYRGMKSVAKAYYCPPPETMQAIEELSMLSDLSLIYVTIPIQAVRSLLIKMGDRLKKLRISNRSQEEPQAERLTLLMEELARSNRELLSLDFQDDEDVLKDRRRRKQRPMKRWGAAPFRIMEPRMQKAFHMLRRNAQFLDWKRAVRSALLWYKLKLVPSIGEEYLNYGKAIPDC